MLIYNVTIKVDHSIADKWLQWLKDEHIPDIVGTSCFTHASILRLIEIDESEGITYAVQYHTSDKKFYQQYLEKYAEDMRKKSTEKWGDKFIAFRTIMEVVY